MIVHLPHFSAQFLRFIAVGLLSTLINYGVFSFLFSALHLHYEISSGAGYLIGVFAGFAFNKSWTYGYTKKSEICLTIKYLAVYCASLMLNIWLLYMMVDRLAMDARVANVLAISVTTCSNFIGTKFWVFRL